VKEVLSQLATVFRYVIVDAPAPAVMRQTAELAPAADAVLLVLKRSRSSRRDAREAVKLIRNRGAEVLGCVMVD
jgi:MinD-like ATPase involved in chromosome partitioning or flagellar assembly